MVGWKVSMCTEVCGSAWPSSTRVKMLWMNTRGSVSKLET